MNIQIPENLTVGQIVARYPETRKFFEEIGIDYCCHGKQQLSDACQKAGLDCSDVTGRLANIIEQPRQPARNWLNASLTELAEHIVSRHHAYLKQNLPRLKKLAEKVYTAHSQAHGAMIEQLIQSFELLRVDIEMHLAKEEQILFPIIKELDSYAEGHGPTPSFHCGSIENPIGQMEYEHDAAGELLEQMRKITSEYELPPDACQSFKALYDGIQELEQDLHEHIHLENNILFPRAVELESRVCR